jgi:hypothetical protein
MTTALPARVSLSRNEDLRLAFELVDENGAAVARPSGTWTFVLKSRSVEVPITLTERSTNIWDAIALVASIDSVMPVGRLFVGDLRRVSGGASSVYASVAVVREDVVQESEDLGARVVRVTRGDGETIRVELSAGSSLTQIISLAAQTAADRVQTGLDRVATGQDRTQTGLDRVQTGLDRVATTQAALDAVASQTGRTLVDLATVVPPASLSGLQVIDGVQTTAGMRVLVHNLPNTTQTSPILTALSNGIYVVASGAWTRATDADTAVKLSGLIVIVRDGAENFGRQFICRSAVVTLGTDPIVFEPQFEGGRNVRAMAALAEGSYALLGDSNSASEKMHTALFQGRFHPNHGPWRRWRLHRIATSGQMWSAYAQNIAAGAVQNATPDRAVAPIDMGPSGNGAVQSIWALVNALNLHPNSVCEVRLGTNDVGLAGGVSGPAVNRQPGGPGHPLTLARNIRTVLTFLVMVTDAQIVIRLPQPFGGFAGYVLGGDDYTRFEVDASDGTRITGAAEQTQVLYRELRKWIGRNPRIEVFDTAAEVYPEERCDNRLTQCLDRQVTATFNGFSVPAANRALIFDALHYEQLGATREEQALMRWYGLTGGADRASFDQYQILGSRLSQENIVDGEWLHWEECSNSGGNTLMKVRVSVENFFWRGPLHTLLQGGGNTMMPVHRALSDGERALFMKRHGVISRLVNDFRGQIRVFFPFTGNIYTVPDIALSSFTTDGDPFSSRFASLQFTGVNMGAETAAHNTTDIGYTGTVRFEQSRRLCYVYVERRDFDGRRWTIPLDIPSGQTRAARNAWIWETGSEFRIARQFSGVRTQAAPATLSVGIYVSNLGFGNFNGGGSTKTNCSISGTTLTTPNGTTMWIGMQVSGAGVSANTYITGRTSDTEWTVNRSQTVGPVSMTFTAAPTVVKQGCSISGTTLTTPDGFNLTVGTPVTGSGVTANTVITARTNDTTYTVNNSQTVGPIEMTFGSAFDGMLVATLGFGSSELTAQTILMHTPNIDMLIGAGLWPGAVGSNWVGVGSGYFFRAIANAAITGQCSVSIAN